MFDDLLDEGKKSRGIRQPMPADEQFEDILEQSLTQSTAPPPAAPADEFDTGQPEPEPKYWSSGRKPDIWRTKP